LRYNSIIILNLLIIIILYDVLSYMISSWIKIISIVILYVSNLGIDIGIAITGLLL
jgi:hypothetical protein